MKNKFKSILKFGEKGSDKGQFLSPVSMAVLKDKIYVVDEFNHRIQKFNINGEFESEWGEFGSNEKCFNSPNDVKIDSNGHIWICDSWNHRICCFDENGIFLKSIKNNDLNNYIETPNGILIVSDNRIVIVNSSNQNFLIYNMDGNFINKIGQFGSSLEYYESKEFKSGYVYEKFLLGTTRFNTIETHFIKTDLVISPFESIYSLSASNYDDFYYLCDPSVKKIRILDHNFNLIDSWSKVENHMIDYPRKFTSLGEKSALILDQLNLIYIANNESHIIAQDVLTYVLVDHNSILYSTFHTNEIHWLICDFV